MGKGITKVLLILTGGLMDDGVTSWALQAFASMDLSGLEMHIVAWLDTDESVVGRFAGLGFVVETLPSRRNEFRAYARSLWTLLQEGGYDAVHVCGSSAIMALELFEAKRCGVGMRIAHSHNTTCAHRLADRVLRPVFYSSATDLVACGDAAGRWLFGSRPFTIIPNGKDLGMYAFSPDVRRQYRDRLGLGEGDVAVGHVGRFNEQKNQKYLCGVFSELHRRSGSYKFFFIGDGELRGEVEALADASGLGRSSIFLGSREDVPQLLNAMDYMVLPSLYEGFPNVVIEWQLNGLPCIVSDSVTRECALTPLVHFHPLGASTFSWADAIERSLPEAPSRSENSRSAVALVSGAGYSINRCASKLRALYLGQGVARQGRSGHEFN